MHDAPLRSMVAWVSYFDQVKLPVLSKTVEELARLKRKEDSLNARELSSAILHDPMMTLKVLRYLQLHHSKNQSAELTTIGQAILMIGTTPFFQYFMHQPLIEDTLAEYPQALEGVMQVTSRAHHAALYAQDWSLLRYDMESDEVTISALLHDMAEILLWCFAPARMLSIRHLQRQDSTLRSATAQQQVLGFHLEDLQLALASTWHLPKLLQSLMDVEHATAPRALRVALAVALARHSANGWSDAALPDDFAAIGESLGMPQDELWQRTRHTALQAAHEWDWYGVAPSAAWLPLLPGAWPE